MRRRRAFLQHLLLTPIIESGGVTIVNEHIARANPLTRFAHFFALILAVAGALPAVAQLSLSTGESFTYQFDTLPFKGEGYTGYPAGGVNYATFTTDPSSRDAGNEFTLEIFENNTSEIPLAIATGTGTVTAQANGGWHDLQGAARITVTSGTLTFNTLELAAFVPSQGVPGEFDGYYTDPITVPEPASMALWACALGGLVCFCKRKRA